MAINAYTGLMGSGKSYEVVSEVICKAVLEGRRVVTNVDDISSEKVRLYVAEKYKVDDMSVLGHIDHCKNTDILTQSPDGEDLFNKNFFYFGNPDVDTFVKPGDLVCLDEAWRFFAGDKKIPENFRIFFREHRHYVDPKTKVSCDLALMVQDISDLHRLLKVVIERTTRTVKLKALGLHNNYRVEVYDGWKLSKRTLLLTEQRKYDPKVFPLYSSYTGGKGVEAKIDRRGSIFTFKFVAGGVFLIFLLIFCLWRVSKFFSPETASKDEKLSVQSHPVSSQNSQSSSPSSPSSTDQRVSSDHFYAGSFTSKEGLFYLVKDQNGVLTVLNRDALHRLGPISWLELDGKRIYMQTQVREIPPAFAPR